MNEKEIIIEKLEDTFKIIANGTEWDSKKLSNISNNLNWILALTTFILGYLVKEESNSSFEYRNTILLISKIVFLFSILSLIIHKIVMLKYEEGKGAYLYFLDENKYDVKYNFDQVKDSLNSAESISHNMFLRAFRSGRFYFKPDKEEVINKLAKLDSEINNYGVILRMTYVIIVTSFILQMTVLAIFLFT